MGMTPDTKEHLVANLIKLLGQSNKRVLELSLRVQQLEEGIKYLKNYQHQKFTS